MFESDGWGLDGNLFAFFFFFNDVMIAFFGSVFAFFFLLMTERYLAVELFLQSIVGRC